jgi:ferredoxin--NADP+ reductase
MAYSETKVVLGGLAHIPIIIGFFYLIKRQYSFGAMLRTGKNALSDKVKVAPTKPAAAKPAAASAKPAAAA